MSSRPQFSPAIVLDAGDMSLATLTSDPTIIQKLSLVSYALSWAGSSPVGTVSVEVSNDFSLNPDGTVRNSGLWTVVTLMVNGVPATTVSISGNSGSGFINIPDMAAYAIRLIYTKGSGTGSLSVIVAGKVA